MATSPSDRDWPVWLGREDVSSDQKLSALADLLATRGTLPQGCDFLWSETSKLAASGRGARALLPRLFRQLDPERLAELLRVAAETNVRSLFAGLVVGASQDDALKPVLSAVVGALDEDRLGTLVRTLGALSRFYPADEPCLGQRLAAWLAELPDQPDRFRFRLVTLRAGARWLPRGGDRVWAWRQFQDCFDAFVESCRQKSGVLSGGRVRAERESLAAKMLAALDEAMPADWYPDDRPMSRQRRLLEGLLAAAALPAGSLPQDFAERASAHLSTAEQRTRTTEHRPPQDQDETARAEAIARSILDFTHDMSDDSWRRSPRQRALVHKVIRERLSGWPETAFLERVAQSPAHARLALAVALEPDAPGACQAAARWLVERIEPLDRLDELLPASPAGRVYKLHALRHYVAAHQELPPAYRWLWCEGLEEAGAEQPLLYDLLKSPGIRLDMILAAVPHVPDEGLGLLFCAVLTTQDDSPAKRELLQRIATRPGFDLAALLATSGMDLLLQRETVQAVLADGMRNLLDRIHKKAAGFAATLAACQSARHVFEGVWEYQDIPRRIEAWQHFQRLLEEHRQQAAKETSRFMAKFAGTRRTNLGFAEATCDCLDRAYPRETHEAFRRGAVLAIAAFAMAVVRDEGLEDLLPSGFPKLVNQYFRRGKKGLNELRKHREGFSIESLLQQPAVVVAAVLATVLLVVIGGIVAFRGDSPSPAGITDEAGQGGTGQATERAAPAGEPDAGDAAAGTGDGRLREPTYEDGEPDAAGTPDARPLPEEADDGPASGADSPPPAAEETGRRDRRSGGKR